MPSIKNTTQLEEVKAALKGAKALILTNYAGLSVTAQNDLRSRITAAGGSYHVFKNTLLKLALQDAYSNLPQTVTEALQGQTAILIAPTDPVAPTKALMKFHDDTELPAIKIGLMDGALLTDKDIISLSKLPGREELLSRLVGQLNAPIYGFAQVLRANLQNLVYVIDAIARKQA